VERKGAYNAHPDVLRRGKKHDTYFGTMCLESVRGEGKRYALIKFWKRKGGSRLLKKRKELHA